MSLLHVEQVLALHGLLQQRSILQHQSLDLVQQVAILLLKVSLQLAQQLTHTHKKMLRVYTTTSHNTDVSGRGLSRRRGNLLTTEADVCVSRTSHWLVSLVEVMSSCWYCSFSLENSASSLVWSSLALFSWLFAVLWSSWRFSLSLSSCR